MIENLKDSDISFGFIFINNCLEYLHKTLDHLKKEIPKEMHFIFNDIMTGTICSVRLGLWGCIADSAAISRVTLEHLAMIDYVIDNHKYSLLALGLEKGFQKVKIDYDSIEKYIDRNIKVIHGRLSDLFLHSTKNRILASGIHNLGKDCIGASLNTKKIKELLGHLCNLSLFSTRVIRAYLKKDLNKNIDFEEQDELENEYKILTEKYKK